MGKVFSKENDPYAGRVFDAEFPDDGPEASVESAKKASAEGDLTADPTAAEADATSPEEQPFSGAWYEIPLNSDVVVTRKDCVPSKSKGDARTRRTNRTRCRKWRGLKAGPQRCECNATTWLG